MRSSANNGTSKLQKAQFVKEHLPQMAMAPHEAVRQMVRNKVDYLPIDQIFGRVAATLFVVYPPGIATIVPGASARRTRRAHAQPSIIVRARRQSLPRFEA